MTRRARRIQERARLSAALERGLAVDVAAWVTKVGRIAATHIARGHEAEAEKTPSVYRGDLARVLIARLRIAAIAAAELIRRDTKSAPALETKGLIDAMIDAATDWIEDYAARRVSQIAETMRKLIRKLIETGHRKATPPGQLAKEIRDATSGEIARDRAIRIARTETHTATETGANRAVEATGLEMDKEYGATEDNRTRPAHAEADGQIVPFDQPFIVGGERMMFCGDPNASPANTVNCFPAETLVSGFPVAVTRHWYDGTLIEVTTTGGHKLSGTPNHPVLTDSGWKPLNALMKGENIATRSVDVERMAFRDPNVKHMQASIGELFNAAARVGFVQRVSRIEVDFHGDRPNHDVDIAVFNGKLGNYGLPGFDDCGSKIGLVTPDTTQSAGVAYSAPNGMGFGLLDTPDRIMSGSSKGRTLLWTSAFHANKHGFSARANRSARIAQALRNFPSISHAEGIGNSFDGLAFVEPVNNLIDQMGAQTSVSSIDGGAHASPISCSTDNFPSGHGADAEPVGASLVGEPGPVSFDKIESVVVRQFSGHVFNLEDHRGNYTASRIIVHNCRCVTLYNPRIPR